jgi:hypothetical protein
MRKKTILLIILVLSVNSAFSQISKIYTYESVANKIDCNIFFYKDGSYKLTLDDYTSENPYQVVLSEGKYVLKNNMIQLIDKYNKFAMQFLYRNKSIEGIKTYQFLQNKKFIKSYLDIYDKPSISDFNNLSLKDSLSCFGKKNKELYNLNYGTYLMQLDFTLNIDAKYNFKFSYSNIVLLQGTWKRNQNEIILNDAFLKHYFYVIIEKDKLKCKILPGGFNNEMNKIK